jgi:two-component system sensor histidine kinase EvgS
MPRPSRLRQPLILAAARGPSAGRRWLLTLAAWAALALTLAALLCGPPPAGAQGAASAPEHRFRATVDGSLGKVLLGPQVLSEEERAFIARLPEIRVAVPLPPAAPYESIDASGLVSGIHPDMLVALGRGFGLRLKPVVMPNWSEALAALRERRVDLMMTIGASSERMEHMAFTLGATPMPGALFTRPGAQVDLERATYVLERDFLAVAWVRRQYPRARVVEVPTTLDALRAVARGEGDAYLGSFLETAAAMAREPVPGIEVNRMLPYGSGYYHFAVRQDWAPLAGILNKGIQTLRNGAADELFAQAVLPPGAELHKPLAVAGAEAALLAARPVWRVGAVRGLALLNEVDERGLHSGIAAEYADQVARRLGVAVQVRAFDSVAQMLDALRAGDIDLVPFLTRTPERERDFAFSAPYVEMPYTLVARSDAPHWWSLDSLRGRRLAMAAQHPLLPLLARDHPEVQVVEAPSGNGAMDMVIRGQADAAVEVKLFANLRVNGPDGEWLRILAEVPELPAQFHFAARQGDGVLLGLVDRALADIGPAERQRMLRRWVAVDLTPPFPWRRYAPAIGVAAAALLMLVGATLWWTRRLAREVQARQRSEQLLTDIATTVPGLAFRYVLNADGSLRHNYFTPGAPAFLGVPLDPQRTVLEALQPHFDPAEYEAALAQQARCMATGEPFKRVGRLIVPGRPERWILAEAIQGRSSNGRTVWTGYIVDVTAEQALQKKLAADAESRNLMLASASHELRAPTHTLSLALQALPREGLSPEQARALKTAEDSAHTLAELLNDVLDAARQGHEPMRLRPRAFDLHQLLGDLGRAWRAAAHTKGLRFDLDIAADVPRTVQLDPLRLKQVVINLLSNACKYTAQGSVTLRAVMVDAQTLRVDVIDTGIGIAAAEQELLFKPFVTLAEGVAVPPEGSTGLGLVTSRHVADLMGATLTLDSVLGEGTRATLVLPLQAALGAPPGPAASARPGTVVVCDDDDTSRLLLTEMLRLKGYDTHDTADSASALQRWREGGVRALVSDLDLPGMSGLELIRSLRDEERQGGQRERTVVIVCSGSPVPAADDAAEQRLYDAYLVKPVQVSTLTDTLQRLGVAAA